MKRKDFGLFLLSTQYYDQHEMICDAGIWGLTL
jgi:hypothetical protein